MLEFVCIHSQLIFLTVSYIHIYTHTTPHNLHQQYLKPDPDAVQELADKLNQSNMGVVAHYYMDVELQGVLTSIQKQQLAQSSTSKIAIADSRAMGDYAVQMCQNGATSIACLGVDFMS